MTRRPPASDPFDLARVRSAWDRAASEAVPVPPRTRSSERPLPADPYATARDLLAKIRATSSERFESHRAALGPFLDRAEALVDQMATSKPPPDAAAGMRAELQTVLDDLEDLFEVFAEVGR